MISALDLGLWKRNRVRLIRQTEIAECGLAALAMVGNYHGLNTDLGVLRRRFPPPLRGSSLKTLMSMADQLGLSPRPVRLPLEKLQDLSLPAVLHWDLNHYVVLERVSGRKALIHNPQGQSSWMALSEISEHFTGFALELQPTIDFEPLGQRTRLGLKQLVGHVSGLKRAVAQTIILSIVMEAFVLASPYYMQISVDSVLPAMDYDLLTILALGFGLLVLINSIASTLRGFVLLNAGAILGYGMAVNVKRRLLQLPVGWFEKRYVGDVLSRFQSVKPIEQFMTRGAVSALVDGSLAIFTLAMMLVYSVTLTLVAVSGFLLYCLVRFLSFSAQRTSEEALIIAQGREQSVMIETLRGMASLRLFAQEGSRQALWQKRLMESTNSGASIARIGIWQSNANTLIIGLETIISLWLAMRMVIGGGFSLGMVFAFIAYKNQFMQKSASLIDQSIAFRMLGLHLERLGDIAFADRDKGMIERSIHLEALSGSIELRNISFRYSASDPPVLKAVNLKIAAGEHVAITGPSGGGKSTLVKLLLSLIEPDDGEIIVDGLPLKRFGYRNYRQQIAAVLQDDSLFAGSFSDNIALFEDNPDIERIVASARAAAFHEDVIAMPMGYDTLVGDMGSSLSGGQRQRLLLARALYRMPKILIMDEGTSHLDVDREEEVNRTIAKLGITRIVIAHRIETIRHASRVLTVENGTIEEATERFEADFGKLLRTDVEEQQIASRLDGLA